MAIVVIHSHYIQRLSTKTFRLCYRVQRSSIHFVRPVRGLNYYYIFRPKRVNVFLSVFHRYDDITDLLGDTMHVSLSADNLSELDQDGILEL